jgi:inorganic triphosphatase YgiF
MQVRREAAQQARAQIEESCEHFVSDCVAEMRRQTAQLCSEMLATIDGTGSVHQKTLNRLQRFIERFRTLNFANDTEMQRELDRARAELLSRSAEEYRGNGAAETTLVQGLERLRTKARELAAQDTSDLAASFGRMGQRRFALAS